MPSWYAGVLYETEKLLRRRQMAVWLALTALIPIATALLWALLQGKAGFTAFTGAGYPVWMLGLFANIWLPLLVFVIAADLFAGETGDRTMKLILVRPLTRFKVYASKLAALGLLVLLNLIVLFVFAFIGSFFLGSAGSGLLHGVFNSIVAYSAALLPLLALSVAAAFIAQLFRSGSGAVAGGIIAYIGARLLAVVLPPAGRMLLPSFMDWHLLWLGSAVPVAWLATATAALLILSYIVIFFAVGYYLFDIKDF